MLVRLWLALGLIACCAAAAHAQTLPETCLSGTREPEPLAALEARRQSLEREAERQARAIAQLADNQPGKLELARNLRRTQEALLELLFQIDCARAARAAPVTAPTPAPPPSVTYRRLGPRSESSRTAEATGPAPAQAIEITTYFATNRKRTGAVEPASFYGSGVETAFEYGRAVVSIPPNHTPGEVELPSLWRLERRADPNKHFVLKSVTGLATDAARREIAERLAASGSKALLLFVHGYNTGFSEAAMRTAQLAHDLKFPGLAFFYSWPSAGQIRAYLQDEETARLCEGVFERLLDDLARLPVKDIYIVAHSMGNRIVGHALQRRLERGKPISQIRELLLAAPDINAEIFRAEIAPKLATMVGTRTTLYASSSDLALRASKVVHGFQRVGETTGGIFLYPGLETIDASSASPVMRGYGHGYLMDSPSVLRDIGLIVEKHGAARARGLAEVGTAPRQYWRFP